jgi:DNA excision repair protein ERCC-8
MNYLHLGHRLGAVSTPAFQRAHNEHTLYSLAHDDRITFSLARLHGDVPDAANVAHNNGVNALALRADILATAGADACIRLWDLSKPNEASLGSATYHPLATLPRSTNGHTNALTSISIYPFDPQPITLISTSYDTNLLLSSITPTSIVPAHVFPLTYAVHCHAISPIPNYTPLIAAGTASPAIRLLDLRTGLATHSLPGHNGAIYSLAWSPTSEHILASGGHDGRVLFFDIRRANAAFAALDAEDPIGVSTAESNRLGGKTGELLDYSVRAHNGPVTSIQWTPYPHTSLVTAGHDQRIRVWDAATGRNELVHFGPRLKNARAGQFGPLLAPAGFSRKPTAESLLWANDDARGEITVFGFREGDVRGTMSVAGVQKSHASGGNTSVNLKGRGRVNAMVWREGEDSLAPDGLEMVSAHADGTLGVWRVPDHTADDGFVEGLSDDEDGADDTAVHQNKKKRKRQDLGALVEGLTKMRLPE